MWISCPSINSHYSFWFRKQTEVHWPTRRSLLFLFWVSTFLSKKICARVGCISQFSPVQASQNIVRLHTLFFRLALIGTLIGYHICKNFFVTASFILMLFWYMHAFCSSNTNRWPRQWQGHSVCKHRRTFWLYSPECRWSSSSRDKIWLWKWVQPLSSTNTIHYLGCLSKKRKKNSLIVLEKHGRIVEEELFILDQCSSYPFVFSWPINTLMI